MSRPWRIEFERALYHVLSRGNEQQDIYLERKGVKSTLGSYSFFQRVKRRLAPMTAGYGRESSLTLLGMIIDEAC